MKKILISGVLLILLSTSCNSVPKDQKQGDITKYISTITSDELSKHLHIVASDEMEGRDTGTEGQKKSR